MKKAWVFLFALVLLFASVSVFADGAAAKWTNWGEGILYPYIQVGTAAASNGWGPNWDTKPGVDQEWTFAYDGNNYGYAATFEFGGNQFATGTSAADGPLTWWQAYYKFFDIAKLTFGKPNIRDYRLTTKIEAYGYNALFNWGDNNGMALQLMPMAGLSLGVALYVPSVNATLNTTALDFANNIGAGASYAIPDMATIAVDWKQAGGANGTKQFYVGVNVTAIKDIGIVAAYQADYSSSANLINSAFASVSAAFAPITVAVDAGLKMTASPSNLYYSGELDLQYAMGMWVIGATVGYDTGTGINGSGTGYPASGLQIYPYVKANFDNGSNVKVGFLYAGGTGTSPVATMGIPVLYTVAF